MTGTPVAGMVYLDRPKPAGYFIFPDLSVRHEGKYRLSFSLYEELKDEKDQDQDEKPDVKESSHVTHRLEVRSAPFTVFSAKKFPGLTESTALSRMVAEQGCRVRIRRDVRMRRRETKSGKEWDGYEDETAEARSRVSVTPDPAGYTTLPPPHAYMDPTIRPRSTSNTSHHSLAPSMSLSRRPSLQEMNQGLHQQPYGNTPHAPQSAYPQSSPYGPSPSQQHSQPPYMQHQPAMQPPPPHYQQQTYQPPPPLPPAPHSHQGYPGYVSTAPPPPPIPQTQFSPQQPSYETGAQQQRYGFDHISQMPSDHRNSSAQYVPPPPPPPPLSQSGYSVQQNSQAYQAQAGSQQDYQQPPPPANPLYASHHSHQPSYGLLDAYGSRPAPAEPVQPPTRATGVTTPLSARPSFNDKLPPLNTTLSKMSNKALEPSSPSSAAPYSSHYNSAQTPVDSHKRGFGEVFNENHLRQPLRQGARPSTPGYVRNDIPNLYGSCSEVNPEDPPPHSASSVNYRRANGDNVQKFLPPHN